MWPKNLKSKILALLLATIFLTTSKFMLRMGNIGNNTCICQSNKLKLNIPSLHSMDNVHYATMRNAERTLPLLLLLLRRKNSDWRNKQKWFNGRNVSISSICRSVRDICLSLRLPNSLPFDTVISYRTMKWWNYAEMAWVWRQTKLYGAKFELDIRCVGEFMWRNKCWGWSMEV